MQRNFRPGSLLNSTRCHLNDSAVPHRKKFSKETQPPLTITAQATTQYAELALGYDLTLLRKAIALVIRHERAAEPTSVIEPDPVLVFAFSLTVAPHLVQEWTTKLRASVYRYGKGRGVTFCVPDQRHRGVLLVVRSMVVEAVLPRPPRTEK